MNNYEAMFIIKPDLSDEGKKNLFNQLSDAVIKNNGRVAKASIWLERRKLYFTIKKYQEGQYYLMDFSLFPNLLKELRQAYKLNENILRVLITRTE